MLTYGNAGFTYGLARAVDSSKQNYYVTDVTDVRGVFLNPTVVGNSFIGTEGDFWLRWGYYGNVHRFNWVELASYTQVRDANHISQRMTPSRGTRAVNTYNTRDWVPINDPLYRAWSSSGGRALRGPLNASHNVIEQYRGIQYQLTVGSNILYDVTTLGNYYSNNVVLEIIPSYYVIDLETRNTDGSIRLVPVDIYQLSSAGEYVTVNIFGVPYSGITAEELDALNMYRLNVNWENETQGRNNRRNVTPRELLVAQEYSDLFREFLYDNSTIPPADWQGGHFQGNLVGRGTSWRQLPGGQMEIGGSQFVSQGYRTQTYIGSHMTYGVRKDGGLFSGANGINDDRYLYWELSAQRWHSTLGLPSDAIFVPLVENEQGRWEHEPITAIPEKQIDIEESLIIVYLDIYAFGDVWTLRYGAEGIERRLTLDDEDIPLPINGPPGPGSAVPPPWLPPPTNPPSTEPTNPGLPFVVFGGSKVPDMAEIIKIN